MERVGRALVYGLIVIGIGSVLGKYLLPEWAHVALDPRVYGIDWAENHSREYRNWPWVTFLHLIPGAVIFILAPLQFSNGLRASRPDFHRWLGRIYVGLGIPMALAAIVLGIAIPFSGLKESVVTVMWSGLFLISLLKAVQYVRRGEIRLHREWMIRGFAVALGISSLRVFYLFFLNATSIPARDFFAYSGVLGITVNLALAEAWIRSRRQPTSRKTA